MAINRFASTSDREVPAGYMPTKFEEEALEFIHSHRVQWDEADVFVTEKVSYLMRNVIEQARKYYYGVFDEPHDEVTGDDKTWVPLVEWSVESVVKSIDLDTKDIVVRPGNKQSINIVPIVRSVILNNLKKMEFGQLLNDSLRVLARDGTVVVKTLDVKDPATGKKKVQSSIVDLLNIWIDPSADTIQTSPGILERIVMSESQTQEMGDVWDNTKFINFSLNVPRIEDTFASHHGDMPFTEIWEWHGKIKKSWITEKDSDEDIWVEGQIISSGLGGPQVIHKIRKNPRKDGMRPYEEAWYKRVDGRWYGRGIAEMLFSLQEYTNMTINIRKNNNLLLQNGIFLIRKGSGLTPEIISRISAGGGLPVTDINRDIKQLDTQDFRQSSYTDEDRTYSMADRVTGAFDINRGEAGLASVSATATLTRDRNIRDTFVLVQEGIGFWIERLITRQHIPLLKKIMTPDNIIRLSGRPEDIAFIDEVIVDNRTNKLIIDQESKTGFFPSEIEIEQFRVEQREALKRMGEDRFVNYFKKIFDVDIDVNVEITDEKFNRTVAIQQLRDMLVGFSRLPVATRLDIDAIMREMLSLMGLKGEFFLNEPRIPGQAQAQGPGPRLAREFPEGVPTEQEAVSTALGLPQAGAGRTPTTGRPSLEAAREQAAPPQF